MRTIHRPAALAGLALLLPGAMASPLGPQSRAAPAAAAAKAGPRTAAWTSSRAAASTGPIMRSVTVSRGQGGIEVHVEGSGPLKPQARTFSHPERIVINLPDVGYYERTLHIPVNAGGVQEVRVSLFQAKPPITRIVVDMAHASPYHLVPAGNRLTVSIDTVQTRTAQKASAPVLAVISATGLRIKDERTAAARTAAETTVAAPSLLPAEWKVPEAVVSSTPTPPALHADARSLTLEPIPPAPSSTASLHTVPEAPPVSAGSKIAPPDVDEEATTPHQAAKENRPLVLRNVSVSHGKDGIAIVIEASGRLKAEARALSDPERIIIDLANVRSEHARRIPVNAGGVQDVNVRLFLLNPLVTRVVVDLAGPRSYHLIPYGNMLTVIVEPQPARNVVAQPPY